ncbi:hypothetical protein BpHYR1_011257 [Brachionus plicatilis]|uniref:Uncharacterized protein n=1 Tax=Brachionus plicatilis TaxID=10195 RepID=A0A3M7RCC5_BRAPC|nr:hypothetical protein BpHYR1_011257 [Brachionus plicatilis]
MNQNLLLSSKIEKLCYNITFLINFSHFDSLVLQVLIDEEHDKVDPNSISSSVLSTGLVDKSRLKKDQLAEYFSCSVVFSRYKKESDNLNLKIYGNRIVSQKEIKFLENNIKKLQAIQNTAVRSILKLKYDTPSNIVHHESFNKLKLLTVSNRLSELCERYVGTRLSHSIPLVERLVKEYKEGFESRHIEYPTAFENKINFLSLSSVHN